MSTLTVTNIQATGETASRAVSGVAAAWLNFNGTGTVAIRDSNNVSSLTDNGTGQYDVTVSNAFSSALYNATMSAGTIAGNSTFATSPRSLGGSYAPTVSNFDVWTYKFTNATDDCSEVNATAHGDLA